MTTVPLTVVLPIGPMQHHCRWLDECLESIVSQSVRPEQLILIDDMHDLPEHDQAALRMLNGSGIDWTIHHTDWRLGNPTAVNIGVARAAHHAVLIMAGDDKLLPGAIEQAWNVYQEHDERDALYYFGVRYSDGRPDQFQPCGCCMVTKGLWKLTGGYDPHMAFGDGDAALCSVLMTYHGDRLLPIDWQKDATPHYWHRIHPDQTSAPSPWAAIHVTARQIITETWIKPEWGRMA